MFHVFILQHLQQQSQPILVKQMLRR